MGMTLSQLEELANKRRQANPEASRWQDEARKWRTRAELLQICFDLSWPTQAQAAGLIGVHRGSIARAIASGRLETNGKTGSQCRVDAISLVQYKKWRDQRERPGGSWATWEN